MLHNLQKSKTYLNLKRMKKIQLISSLILVFFLIKTAGAQTARSGNWCGTEQATTDLQKNKGGIGQNKEAFEEYIQEYIANIPQHKISGGDKSSPYIIPVVFHCITDNGEGYCSKASIEAQIDRLNQDFQRTNIDAANTRAIFQPYAMSMNIEFRLAHKAPDGSCTEGIVRTDSPLSTSCVPRNDVKSVSYWDSKKYFNIWVVNSIDAGGSSGIILGYAQFPSGWGNGINSTYGVVIDNDYVSGTDRTLTHELGHCFGLYHTFQSGCGSNCSNSGDNVCDTPPSSNSTFGCVTTQNTCINDASGSSSVYSTNVVDQIENYMSYDACQNMFTLGQKTRMQAVLDNPSTLNGLDQLNTSANHAFTGVADPYTTAICKPIAGFTYDEEYICEGGNVTYTDDSYNATPTAWNWTFTGGTPNVSLSSNPTIIYSTPGVYDVTYEPSTSAGSDVITKTNIVTVSSLTADYGGALVYDFENGASYANDWIVTNSSGVEWERNSTASVSGANSIRIRNSETTTDGEFDVLISPSFNVSSVSTKTMTFKQAFVKKNSANNDRLFVYYSTNCGQSWNYGLLLTSSSLSSSSTTFQSVPFVPTSGDWVTRVVDLSSISTATNVRFKFEFKSGGGNDLYIDDINLGNGSVSVKEFSKVANFSIYPNPTKSSAQISFNLIEDVNSLSIKVRNAVGQEVTSVIDAQAFSSGKYTLKIDEERKLASGIYFVQFNADDNVKVQKLIVQ